MADTTDFERKRAELDRRRTDQQVSRLMAKVVLLPPEGQAQLQLLVDAFLVADEEEAARLIAAAGATPLDQAAVAAMAREILLRHAPNAEATPVPSPSVDATFHAIARRIAEETGVGRLEEWDPDDPAKVVSAIAEQLRQVWNDRGAADRAKLEGELSSQMGATAAGPYVKNLDRALRGLDR